MKACCFTGHRTIPTAVRQTLIARLDKKIEELIAAGFTEFRTGGALGFDTLAALRVLYFRTIYSHIKLHLYLPCADQCKNWREEEQRLWQDIKERADKVFCLQEHYSDGCMHQRNRAMVDGCGQCVAYLRQNKGGTLYTCTYAIKSNIPLCNLAPELK